MPWAVAVLTGLCFFACMASNLDLFWKNQELSKGLMGFRGMGSFDHPLPRYKTPYLSLPPPSTVSETPSPVWIDVDGQALTIRSSWADHPKNPEKGWVLHQDAYILFYAPQGRDPRKDMGIYTVHYPLRIPWSLTAFFGGLFLAALVFRNRMNAFFSAPFSPQKWGRLFFRFCFFLGAALILLNLAGLFIPLRNSDIYTEPHCREKEDITLTEKQALEMLRYRPGETNRDYASRAVRAVSQGLAHYWWDNGMETYRIRVPPWENYILFAASFIQKRFLKYEFYNHRKALARGVGMCGQAAVVLVGFLKENGIDARIVSLNGHTVTTALLEPETWHILDPDMGVHIPHNMESICSDPESVLPYYTESGLPFYDKLRRSSGWAEKGSQEFKQKVIRWYSPGKYYIDSSGVSNYAGGPKYVAFEKWAYKAKWVLPILLMGPWALFFIFGRIARQNHV